MSKRLAVPAALLLSVVLLSAAAQAQDDTGDTNAIDDTPHITMIGTASIELPPDIAIITLGVGVEKPRAADAAGETARLTRAVIDAATAQGVEARDIQTRSLTITQVYDTVTDSNGRYTGRKPRGFSALNTIAIRSRALDKTGVLIQSLIDKGANTVEGISFQIEKPDAKRDELLASAMRDAKHKADIAASALGVRLGPVLLIERPEAGPSGVGFAAKSRMLAPAIMDAPAPMPVEGGSLTLDAAMEVTWAIAP